jgi:hypothetical protein
MQQRASAHPTFLCSMREAASWAVMLGVTVTGFAVIASPTWPKAHPHVRYLAYARMHLKRRGPSLTGVTVYRGFDRHELSALSMQIRNTGQRAPRCWHATREHCTMRVSKACCVCRVRLVSTTEISKEGGAESVGQLYGADRELHRTVWARTFWSSLLNFLSSRKATTKSAKPMKVGWISQLSCNNTLQHQLIHLLAQCG